MGYKPAKWPSYALGALEDALSIMRDIERETERAQQAAADGKPLEAVMLMSNIRTKSMTAHSTLIQAKSGEYKRN
jgi:hypothetical protein